MLDLKRQPWIKNKSFDLIWIISPSFLSIFLGILVSLSNLPLDYTPQWAWVMLILMIDVAHVHSTLFKTYFDSNSFKNHKITYILVPILGYLFFVFIYQIGTNVLYWRLLAYLAVFHFIRQQYGFVRLYNRDEAQSKHFILFDEIIIYSVTFIPIIHWHFDSPRNFSWFVQNDFYFIANQSICKILKLLYLLLIISFLLKEIYVSIKFQVNLPRILIISGSILTWYFGIIYFNNDLIFTLFNVVGHGIPYMALVWNDVNKKKKTVSGVSTILFSKYGVVFFLTSLIALAYFEEGLWDGMLWKENESIFQLFYFLPDTFTETSLSFLIPLLALPQITHYILDGFIWKRDFK